MPKTLYIRTTNTTKMKLYFELKKINEKQGTIRAILIQQGKKGIISTGRKIDIKDWKDGKPKAIGKNGNAISNLKKYEAAFNTYMRKVELADELPSLIKGKEFINANVKSLNAERGKKDIHTLITKFKNEKEGFMREGALKPFTTLSNHLADYSNNIQFADFNEDFANKFSKYLSQKTKHIKIKGTKNLQNPTINKMLVTLKVFCKWAFKNKYTSAADWMSIKKVKETDQRIITLTGEELNSYFNFNFGNRKNLERAKDVFCFASFLGLRYNDLKQVNTQNIKKGYLHINTQKTNKELIIKLIPQALQILDKYNNILPLDISNQKLNKNIKEGVRVTGILRKEIVITQHLNDKKEKEKFVHELISIHDARKTFITLCLQNGLSITEVMQMSTHDSYKSFARYINIEQSKVDEKLENVFGHLKIA